MKRRRERKRTQVPKVLKAVYGDKIRCMREYILDILGPSLRQAPCSCSVGSASSSALNQNHPCPKCDPCFYLLRDDDHEDYWTLMETTYAFQFSAAPVRAQLFPLENRWTQRQIVERASEIHFQRSSKSIGCYQVNKDKLHMGSPLPFSPVKHSYSNVEVHLLNSHPWTCLLSRVGDVFMLHLLLDILIFHPLPNESYLQIFGGSNETLLLTKNSDASQRNIDSKMHSRFLDSKRHSRFLKRSPVSVDLTRSELEGKGIPMPVFSKCERHRSETAVSSLQDVSGNKEQPRKNKRPFRWQRHKKYREQKRVGTLFTGLEDGSTGNIHSESLARKQRKPDANSRKFIFQDDTFLCNSESQQVLKDCEENGMVYKGHENYTSTKIHSKSFSTFEYMSQSVPSKTCNPVSAVYVSQIQEKLINVDTRAGLQKCNQTEEAQITHGKAEEAFSLQRLRGFKELISLMEKKAMPNALIDRSQIFYKSIIFQHHGFPNNHILNVLKPDMSGAICISKDIFGFPTWLLDVQSSCETNYHDKSIFESLLSSFRHLIKRAQHCQYMRLLDRHCPNRTRQSSERCLNSRSKSQIPNAEKNIQVHGERTWINSSELHNDCSSPNTVNSVCNNDNRTSVSKDGEDNHRMYLECMTSENKLLKDSLASYSTHDEVVSFVWATIRSIVPVGLLGSQCSWRVLTQKIGTFVSLRRFEKFSLQHCLYKLKASHFFVITDFCFNYCTSQTQNQLLFQGKMDVKQPRIKTLRMILQQRMLQTWLFWLFSYFIVPLISAHFYVTESENGKYGVFYYRKDVWDKVSKEAVHYLKENNYRQINISSLEEMFRNRKLGFSKVRFLPKATGVRPIANLGATSKICFNFQRNLNESSTRRERRREEYNSLIFSTQKWKGSAVDHCRKKIKYSFSNKVEDGNALGRGNSHMPHMIPELKKTKAKLFGSYAQDVMSFKSINSLLYDAHQCLKLEKEECSEALGFSVFDYNDVFKKLVPFLMNLKVSLMGPPKFYVVACDIEKAFDSVSHDKLLSIMEQCLQRDKYWVQRYKRISYFGTKVRVAYERCFVQDMNQNASGNIPFRTRKHCHCIFINQATLTMVKREELFSLIMEHVKRNVTRIGGIFYIQKVGIPQGSVLSSLLFSFYYGHLERNKILPLLSDIQQHTGPVEYTVHHPVAKVSDDLSGTNVKKQTSDHEFRRRDSEESGSIKMLNMPLKGTHNEAFCKNEASAIDLQSSQDVLSYNPSCFKNNKMNYGTTGPVALDQKSLVLRLIDDFLLISTSREASVSFVIAMHEGFREYNCRSNHKKTSLNFDMEISGKHLLQNMQVSEDGSCFIPWAGLLINASSLEIQADYKRYCDVHIRSTITVWRQRKPGCHLLMKLGQFVRPKCHPILYDVNINSRVTLRLNAYQAFLLCAMKFHAYVSSMPPDGCFNARNQFKAIFKTSRYFYTLLIQRIRNICLEMGMSPQRPFMLKEIEWLALLAFYKVLLRKQCRYRQLIKLLKIKASNSRYKNLPWADLEQAVDDSRSSVLWKLRY